MKKISLFILGLVCLFLTGCGESKETKEIGSLDRFRELAVSNGFTVRDKTSEYANEGIAYITGSMEATINDSQIEMVIYDSAESAEKTHKQHRENFLQTKGTAATATKEKGANYYKFSMISNGYYMVSSRIENTLIFTKTPLANKEKMDAILNGMNY